jgi:hypothetical protein
VILLLSGTDDDELPFGVIINKAISSSPPMSWNILDDTLTRMISRKGGPVCRGRLGIVRHMILHTLNDNDNDDQEPEQVEEFQRLLQGVPKGGPWWSFLDTVVGAGDSWNVRYKETRGIYLMEQKKMYYDRTLTVSGMAW